MQSVCRCQRIVSSTQSVFRGVCIDPDLGSFQYNPAAKSLMKHSFILSPVHLSDHKVAALMRANVPDSRNKVKKETKTWRWFDTGRVRTVIDGPGVVIYVFFCSPVLFWAAIESPEALACSPLLLENSVDVVHFAQLFEERDEVQQLGVGHVVEPRGHGHLSEEEAEINSTT